MRAWRRRVRPISRSPLRALLIRRARTPSYSLLDVSNARPRDGKHVYSPTTSTPLADSIHADRVGHRCFQTRAVITMVRRFSADFRGARVVGCTCPEADRVNEGGRESARCDAMLGRGQDDDATKVAYCWRTVVCEADSLVLPETGNDTSTASLFEEMS